MSGTFVRKNSIHNPVPATPTLYRRTMIFRQRPREPGTVCIMALSAGLGSRLAWIADHDGDLHARAGELQILDVRERSEWDTERIPGSMHTRYHDIDAIAEWIDPGRPVAVVCASGQRAAFAASLLARHGAKHVVHVTSGGVGQWKRAGHPVERSARSTRQPSRCSSRPLRSGS